MLRTTCPNISIITNFGCRSNCWYCIWKGHRLENVKIDTDWKKLYDFLLFYHSKGKVSVSGGGDCLYKFDKYKFWWESFFNITEKLHMLVDIHTREKFTAGSFWEKINRCVFSSDRLENDIDYLRCLSKLTKIRITHLVTKETTNEMIQDYLIFKKEINCQFTIKELVGHDDGGRYKKIKEKYPDIIYLDAGDYNIYYMPDNSTTDTFL